MSSLAAPFESHFAAPSVSSPDPQSVSNLAAPFVSIPVYPYMFGWGLCAVWLVVLCGDMGGGAGDFQI